MNSRIKIVNNLSVITVLFVLHGCSTDSTPVYTLTTNVSPVEAGLVTPATAEVDEDEQVQITASANEHWVFTGWQGDYNSTSNPAFIQMDDDKIVTALFAKRDYPLTVSVNDEDGGYVEERLISSKTTDYPHETVVELTASASNGWEFTGWSGDLLGVDNPKMVTITGPMNVTANFKQIVSISIEGNGVVQIEILEETAKTATSSSNAARMARITAIPENDWLFHQWGREIISFENPKVISFTDEINIEAVFLFEAETVTDIDGNLYPTVKIGNQIWVAENLRVSQYNDGTEIPGGLSDIEWEFATYGAYAIFPFERVDGLNSLDEVNQIYGKFYNWHAVNDSRGLCMEGWKIPSYEDWRELFEYVGHENAGGKLKKPGPFYWYQPQRGYTNETGFSGIGAGLRYRNGFFTGRLYHGYWWLSTEYNNEEAYGFFLDYEYNGTFYGTSVKTSGDSIRCIKKS